MGHHFASRTNPFWKLLHAAGLTPELLTYAEDQRLAEWGIGLTNLCPRPTRQAADLTRAEIEAGKVELARKIGRARPKVVAFVGLTLYQQYFGHKASGGAGEKPERIAGARVFVLPNPSGLNANFPGFAHKRVWFERLRAYAREGDGHRGPPPSDEK